MNWLTLENREHATGEFCKDVITGLQASPKQIPSKYLYDRRGSELFDEICELEEYYVTRTELAIVKRYAREMADAIGDDVCLVELGSGSSSKTRYLLRSLRSVSGYIPMDISADYLFSAADRLQSEFPELPIRPRVGDFTEDQPLPESGECERLVFYFPGSTIGNLSREQSVRLLKRMSAAGQGSGLLIGIDLQKEPEIINAAYNDSLGVTAAFSKNLLTRINRELGGRFNSRLFEHVARYDSKSCQVEIGLQSQVAHRVRVNGCEIQFDRGEMIHTETSRKYRIDEFSRLASAAGFQLVRSWSDRQNYFAVLYLES